MKNLVLVVTFFLVCWASPTASVHSSIQEIIPDYLPSQKSKAIHLPSRNGTTVNSHQEGSRPVTAKQFSAPPRNRGDLWKVAGDISKWLTFSGGTSEADGFMQRKSENYHLPGKKSSAHRNDGEPGHNRSPEPAIILLFGTGLIGLVLISRKRLP